MYIEFSLLFLNILNHSFDFFEAVLFSNKMIGRVFCCRLPYFPSCTHIYLVVEILVTGFHFGK